MDLLLAPAINIKRNPLGGRNFEYYSEDPVLTAKLAAGYVEGVKNNGVAVCVKHFACNNQEKDRWVYNCVVNDDALRNLYLTAFEILLKNADVLHCEPIEKVADDVIGEFRLERGSFDNVSQARYAVPDVWTMGKVYARLIEDASGEDDVEQTLMCVYGSWIDEKLSDYNSSFYYEPRDYIAECFRQGMVIDG